MAQFVDDHLGSDDGIVVVDESGVPRWGDKSVGIGRQYIGNVGKVANGRIGVYLTYASEPGQAFLDMPLYIPEEWFADTERCRAAGIPQGVVFRKKPQLDAAMVEQARRRGIPGRWLAADEAYGNNPTFLDVVDAVRWWYVAEVPVNLEVWPTRPQVLPRSPRSGTCGRAARWAAPAKKPVWPASPTDPCPWRSWRRG